MIEGFSQIENLSDCERLFVLIKNGDFREQ
jgi:hypothetical protein